MSNIYAATSLIGGGTGALDLIDGSGLADKDAAIVFVQGVGAYYYILDEDSGATESSPSVISPDTNAGTKRWILHETMSTSAFLKLAGGTMSGALAMGSQKITGLGAPASAGDAVRATAKITEANLESAVDLKHAAVTIPGSSPLSLAIQALTLNNDAGNAITEVDSDETLAQNLDTVLATQKAIRGFVTPLTSTKALPKSITMLAATSGSTGIRIANNDNINFGIGDFSIVFRGAIVDWSPGLWIMEKRHLSGSDFYGFMVKLETTGRISLYLYRNDAGTGFTSTVALPITDGTAHEVTIVVKRETAAVAGSVSFYVDGALVGASVEITAATPVTITTTGTLYILGTSSTRVASTTQFFATFNLALSAAGVVALYRNGIDYADKWGNQTTLIVSNCVNASGANACPTFESATPTGFHAHTDGTAIQTAGTADEISIVAGCKYRVTWTYTPTSGNISSVGVRSGLMAGTVYIGNQAPTLGSFEFTATANDTVCVYFRAEVGAVCEYTISDLSFVKIGATCVLDPSFIYAKYWPSLCNSLVAYFPSLYTINGQAIRGFVNVLEFGALGDNVANDTVAINAALATATAIGGGIVFFPVGQYRYAGSGELGDSVIVEGVGYASEIIATTASAAYIFYCSGVKSGIRRIKISAEITQTAGTFVLLAGSESFIEYFYIRDAYKGIYMTGNVSRIRHGIFKDGANGVISIHADGGDQSQSIDDILVHAQSPIPTSSIGILAEETSALVITNSSILTQTVGLKVAPQNGEATYSMIVDNCFFDNCTYGIQLHPASGATIKRLRITDSWASSAPNGGISITGEAGGGTIIGVTLSHCHILFNGSYGISTGYGCTDITIDACEMSGNALDGVMIYRDMSTLKILGSTIGEGLSTGNGAYGINLRTTGISNVVIANNILLNNTSGSIDDNSTATSKIIEHNIGYP